MSKQKYEERKVRLSELSRRYESVSVSIESASSSIQQIFTFVQNNGNSIDNNKEFIKLINNAFVAVGIERGINVSFKRVHLLKDTLQRSQDSHSSSEWVIYHDKRCIL